MRDLIIGIIFIFVSMFFFAQMSDLMLGSLIKMGPAFFPLFFSSILFVIGSIKIIKYIYHEFF